MTFLDTILASAAGQLLAVGVVVVAWTIVQLWGFLRTYAKAASQTRIEIVCKRK